jgi:hypothetical protein
VKRSIVAAVFLLLFASTGFADEVFSVSGMLKLWASLPLNSESETESPSFTGRVKIDTFPARWRFHAWIEGGWDGGVQLESRDHAIVRTYNRVYQRNTPYLELKECYGAYGTDVIELRVGIQRFAWGRLDEYPINDHLNPWDYTRFLIQPLEDRKIGVPSFSAILSKNDWSFEAVWVPLLVPYRLSLPGERWSGFPDAAAFTEIPGVQIVSREPDLPPRQFENSSTGLRLRHSGPLDWGINLFHGYDFQPVFKTTELTIRSLPGKIIVDPGYEPDFHKFSSIGIDTAGVRGDWSLRVEAAYSFGRYFNTRWERWGYPSTLLPRRYVLEPNEIERDAMEYGFGLDYRLFEDCLLIVQVQQRAIIDRPDTLYDRRVETLTWATVKTGWLNRKVETTFTAAYNPEHGGVLVKTNAVYVITDYWKAGIAAALFDGDEQSLFGRFSRNNQLEAEIVYSW